MTGLRLDLVSFDGEKKNTVKFLTGILLKKWTVEMNAELVCFVCTFLFTPRFFLGSGVRGQMSQLHGLMAPHPAVLLG